MLYLIPSSLPALLSLSHTHGSAQGSISPWDLAVGVSNSRDEGRPTILDLKEPRHNSIKHVSEVFTLMIIHSQAFIIPFGSVAPSQFHVILPAPDTERALCLLCAASLSAMLREFFLQEAFFMPWRTISPPPRCPHVHPHVWGIPSPNSCNNTGMSLWSTFTPVQVFGWGQRSSEQSGASIFYNPFLFRILQTPSQSKGWMLPCRTQLRVIFWAASSVC